MCQPIGTAVPLWRNCQTSCDLKTADCQMSLACLSNRKWSCNKTILPPLFLLLPLFLFRTAACLKGNPASGFTAWTLSRWRSFIRFCRRWSQSTAAGTFPRWSCVLVTSSSPCGPGCRGRASRSVMSAWTAPQPATCLSETTEPATKTWTSSLESSCPVRRSSR